MSRMKQIRLLPEMFQRELPQDYSLIPKYDEENPIPIFKLKFDPEIAYRLYDEFRENQVSLCGDGTYLVTARYSLSNWTFNYLLSFGKHVEIIEPEIARTMLKERALAIAGLYT